MSDTIPIAKQINEDIKAGHSIAQIRASHGFDNPSWQRYSAKAYALNIDAEKRKRRSDEKRPHVSTTSATEVADIFKLNAKLASFAILLPVTATIADFEYAAKQADQLPGSELELLSLVEKLTMGPLFRARQKKGRFETFPHFRSVYKLIDAATLCFYRQNYISCYLTLVPVIEGILLRWLGYNGGADKPNFEQLRKFFRNGYQRQPMPWNVQFHQIFSKGCGELLEQHFFKPSGAGRPHDLFSRHLAAHLLEDGAFATKPNCLRLFMLLDAMSEIFYYESRGVDPRFSLHSKTTEPFALIFATLRAESALLQAVPEKMILTL